jgi:hypothetical protein
MGIDRDPSVNAIAMGQHNIGGFAGDPGRLISNSMRWGISPPKSVTIFWQAARMFLALLR